MNLWIISTKKNYIEAAVDFTLLRFVDGRCQTDDFGFERI